MDDKQRVVGREITAIVCRVLNHLPEISELSTISVKGHLIAEEELNRAILFKLKYPSKYQDVKLSFSQLLSLVKCLYSDEAGWIWGGLDKLNKIRNKYAHSLEPNGVQKYLVEFVELVEAKSGEGTGAIEERMRRCIAFLCAQVTLLYSKEVV